MLQVQGQNDAHGVGADEGGNQGKGLHVAAALESPAELLRASAHHARHQGNVWSHGQLVGIHPVEDVDHDRISHFGAAHHPLPLHTVFLQQRLRAVGYRLQSGFADRLWIFPERLGAGDHICAEGRLPVQHSLAADAAPGLQIVERHVDGRRAQVDGKPVHRFV